jgi:hypothetical protein
MRSVSRALLLSAGLVLLGPGATWADSPHPVNYNFHEPNDLIAYQPPGPALGTDGTGDQLPAIQAGPGRPLGIYPPRVLDQSLLNDPDTVKWPTLDKSEWERLKGNYKIVPR